MAADPSSTKRFLIHSLWVLLPFCAMLGLSVKVWRSDAETRAQRVIQSSHLADGRALEEIKNAHGPWLPLTLGRRIESPPLPNDSPEAKAARDRYEAGDFEGVLGSPEALRSSAGLPLRKLAALQLLRQETDPSRLGELVTVLATSMDFTSPPFLEEAERRFAELKIPPPTVLATWRERWLRIETEDSIFQAIQDDSLSNWIEQGGMAFLYELNPKAREWRLWSEAEIRAIATNAHAREVMNLADGTALRLSVAGKILVGPDGKSALTTIERALWRADIVMVDESAFRRNDIRTRNFMAAVLTIAGLAVIFGLWQAGRAYLRAVELARRQAEFMAAISHEMRTPLAAMRLLAENLESGVADRSGQRAEHTRMIREECARLGDLVGNVLAFTRDGNSEPFEAFDIAAMVADVASLVEPMAAKKGIHFECSCPDFPEAPSGDVAALRRALLNLLDNALKHTPDGGQVSCRAFPNDESTWNLQVCDSGPGVPASERERIFEPFYRIGDELRRTTPGTGLGLALVKRTADAHGGKITVSDAAGGGACFNLSLPIRP
jgi:signal transduction histidine kinase